MNHRVRYEWAARRIGKRLGALGLDAFCGTGYGTQHLADETESTVLGIDASAEAIQFADKHFSSAGTLYAAKQYPFRLAQGAFDFAVSFESMEHIEDSFGFFSQLARSVRLGGMICLSTPNEKLCPHAVFKNPFHVRHFTLGEILSNAKRCGLETLEWHGQNIHQLSKMTRGSRLPDSEMELRPETEGQNLIFAFERRR